MVVDFDGVIVSPAHEWAEHLDHGKFWPPREGLELVKRIRDSGRAEFSEEKMAWFNRVLEASDEVVLWTSRRLDMKNRSSFPHFPLVLVQDLERLGKGKLKVLTGKTLQNRGEKLWRMIDSRRPRPDMTYVVWSSAIDRREQRLPSWYGKGVKLFDTAHAVL